MKVLIDVNVALDVIPGRQPWLDDSKGVWDACHETRILGHWIATAVTDIFSVSRRLIGTEKARAGVRIGLATFEIIPVGRDELKKADTMAGSDLEDDVSSPVPWPRASTPSSPAIRWASRVPPFLSCPRPNCWPCSRRTNPGERIGLRDQQETRMAPGRAPDRTADGELEFLAPVRVLSRRLESDRPGGMGQRSGTTPDGSPPTREQGTGGRGRVRSRGHPGRADTIGPGGLSPPGTGPPGIESGPRRLRCAIPATNSILDRPAASLATFSDAVYIYE